MKHKILFLAANPVGLTARKLDEEAREIQEEIQLASQRDQFEFVPRLAAQPMDLLRALRQIRPSIVHFVGHARTDGIYLKSGTGQPMQVTGDALRATFGAAGRSVQLVVLNGCATEDLAKALCELVPVCIGTPTSISDDAARAFSVGFYGALASSESAMRACLQGRAAMLLEATGNHDPLLHHHCDVDPATFVLAEGIFGAGTETIVDAPTPPVSHAPALPPSASPVPVASLPPPAPAATTSVRNPAGTDLIAPLVLLQLSDLHFGPHGRFAASDLAHLAARCRQDLDEARGDLGWREPIGLVLVTGDIAEAARPPEYATALAFFTGLARELALPPHRFVFVPGNHDVSWTKCREVEGQLEDGAFPPSELRARLDTAKLAHFERFLRDFHGKARHELDDGSVTALSRGAFLYDFAELGVSIAALNSCERESHRQADHVGALGAEQAQSVLDHWRRAPADRIRIAALHHNPGPVAPEATEQWLEVLRDPEFAAGLPSDLIERIATDIVGFDGRGVLKDMSSDAHVSLIFHGHHHASTVDRSFPWRGCDLAGPRDTQILSAGSWGLSRTSGKLPKEQPIVMQLVRLDPAAAQLHPVLLAWNPNAGMTGSIQPGRFAVDGNGRAERPSGLSLPPALRGRFHAEDAQDHVPAVVWPEPRPRPPSSDLAAVIERYRRRKSGSFERWDLRTAGPTPTTGNRPAEITLDEMYIPLRFDPVFDSTDLDRGTSIDPDDLLGPRQPQVVIGAAGSGKTTWMRWTFRRLIHDVRAVPFFLELRAIAASWKTPQDAARPVESYLADALSECGAADPNAVARALLADTTGPQPVLLVDGWDELGAQGERLRERLVELCRAFPQVNVVVSSRPYSETRPAGAEAFETVYIQPLSDEDVRLLATHFHRCIYGHDEPAGARATDEFTAALAAASGARSLAGTALLLTMMLLLSREGPLPDRRHKLYTACLRNMLLHRVTQRERDGVVIDLDQQWRPDDSEERLRVVAEMAYRMQTVGYRKFQRAPMVIAWNDAVDLLGGDWTRDQRERFLRWLVASAGVLIDRTDGSVQFAHLSFQEHLAAYYLFIAREGDHRVAAVRSHMGDRSWWETLRLWAGLISDHWPDKLGPILDVLRASADTYWLAGQMLADGTGRRSDFDAWVAELPAHLSDPFVSGKDCALAWGACKQEDRRGKVAATLASARGGLHWLGGIWHAHWCKLAKLEVEPAPALVALELPIDSAVAVARSRVLHGASASWPDGGELALLRLWPSTRVAIGVRLQTATSLGARMPEVAAMVPPLLAWAHRAWSAKDHARVKEFVRAFARYLSPVFARDFARYFVRYSVRYFVRHSIRYLGRFFGRALIRDLLLDFRRDVVQDLVQDFIQDFVRSFIEHFSRRFGRLFPQDFVRYFAGDFGFSEPTLSMPWLSTLAVVEAISVAGRASPRAALAHGTVPDGVPLLALFRTACQASFAPDDTSLRTVVARACDAFDGDPLWPALARHVARISTTEDRALLEDLARHPEKREPPLSWGLQHYVRGDLVLDDDAVVTLDELCARTGLEPLPLLEDMPDELA